MKYSFVIYNHFFEHGNFRLDIEQLYVYGMLAFDESKVAGYTKTTLNIITQTVGYYSTTGSKNRTINFLKGVIKSLDELGVIKLEIVDDEEWKANTLIRIRFPDLGHGYEHIYLEQWESSNNPAEFYIICTLKRIFGFQKAKNDWSEMLGYGSNKTGFELVTKMENEGKIYHVKGKFEKDAQGKLKQLPPKWYLGKSPDVMKTEEDEQVSVENIDEEVNWGNWKNGNLTEDDYVLYYRQIDNSVFKKVADAKLKRITKNGENEKAAYAVEKMMLEAEDIMDRDKKKHKLAKNEEIIENIVKNKGICIIENDEPVEHLDVKDWNLVSKMYYPDGEGLNNTIVSTNMHGVYEEVLSKYQYIDDQILYNELQPRLKQVNMKNETVM